MGTTAPGMHMPHDGTSAPVGCTEQAASVCTAMEPTSHIQADASAQPARYTVPKLEGAFTLRELVAMDISKDPRLSKARSVLIPPESCQCLCNFASKRPACLRGRSMCR